MTYLVGAESAQEAGLGGSLWASRHKNKGKEPFVERLPSLQVSVLVMCHTRELAFQISKEYERFSKYMPSIKVRAESWGSFRPRAHGVHYPWQVLCLEDCGKTLEWL